MPNPHVDSSFDGFLDKEGIAADVTEQAVRELIHHLAQDGRTPTEITVSLACQLFAEKALGLTKAARLSRLSPQSFIEKLAATAQTKRAKRLLRCRWKNGAQGRNRTTDTAIFSRMLYQLSYLGSGVTEGPPV